MGLTNALIVLLVGAAVVVTIAYCLNRWDDDGDGSE